MLRTFPVENGFPGCHLRSPSIGLPKPFVNSRSRLPRVWQTPQYYWRHHQKRCVAASQRRDRTAYVWLSWRPERALTSARNELPSGSFRIAKT